MQNLRLRKINALGCEMCPKSSECYGNGSCPPNIRVNRSMSRNINKSTQCVPNPYDPPPICVNEGGLENYLNCINEKINNSCTAAEIQSLISNAPSNLDPTNFAGYVLSSGTTQCFRNILEFIYTDGRHDACCIKGTCGGNCTDTGCQNALIYDDEIVIESPNKIGRAHV